MTQDIATHVACDTAYEAHPPQSEKSVPSFSQHQIWSCRISEGKQTTLHDWTEPDFISGA